MGGISALGTTYACLGSRVAVVARPDGCVVWTGSLVNGYGQLAPEYHGGHRLAHRAVYAAAFGPIPDGAQIDHVCHDPDVCRPAVASDCPHRACVNPDHLRAVTPRENTLRSYSPIAVNAAKTHCIYGHPFDEKNTYLYQTKSGMTQRGCRICRAAIARAFRKRQAAAA